MQLIPETRQRSTSDRLILAGLLYLLLFSHAGHSQAAGPDRHQPDPHRDIYITQVDDTLPHVADKYFHDPQRWPAVAQASSQGAGQAALVDPYFLRPGQTLIIPPAAQVDALMAAYAASQPVRTRTPTQPVSARWLADFTAYVDQARQHFQIPGAAVAVVHNNQIALAHGFGVRELNQPAPVTPETIFGIGSTTKAMNSMLIATLVAEGRLSWDSRAVDLWPDFTLSDPILTPQVRLRDLLSMRSGLPRSDLAWSGSGLTARQVMDSLANLPLEAQPGARFAYNNQAAATGGYLAALAAGSTIDHLGQDYPRLMQQRIFEPIGMKGATFDLAAMQANPNHAAPHDFTLSGSTRPTRFAADAGITPAGEAKASITDLARFVQTQLAYGVAPDGTRVAPAAVLVETWQPQIELYPGNSYAMGWFVETYQGQTMIWHDGDVLGFKSLLLLLPEANAGLALLSNRTVSYGFSNSIRYHFVESLYGLEADAGEHFREQWTEFIQTALPNIRETVTAAPPARTVAPYLGQYQAGWWVAQRPNGTVWTGRGDYEWQLWAEDETVGKFIIGNGFGLLSTVDFTPDEQGRMTMQFKLTTGETGTYKRVAGSK